MTPFCPIIMGSKSDLSHGRKIADALAELGIESEIRVSSAHKVPAYATQLLAEYEAMDRPIVYVTIAGRSNALSGLVDGQVSRPVVACPPTSSSFGGADIFSTIRMPSGIAPAAVLEPVNAALLVAKIFAMGIPSMREKVAAAQQRYQKQVTDADAELRG